MLAARESRTRSPPTRPAMQSESSGSYFQTGIVRFGIGFGKLPDMIVYIFETWWSFTGFLFQRYRHWAHKLRKAHVKHNSTGLLIKTYTYTILLYYTILYYTILYYTILYYTILYYTILYYTILYYTILYYTILYYTILYYTILIYTILYYTILYYTILYYTILYYTILIYTILY